MAALVHAEQPVQAVNYSNDVNSRFHTLIAQASQNPVLEIIIDMLVGIVWRQQRLVDVKLPLEQHAVTASQHEQIVRAIADRDPDGARRAMLEHLTSTRQGMSDSPGSLDALIQALYTT
jgi:GntR family transcriptional repressor for pyruvate dehydrogenase complex